MDVVILMAIVAFAIVAAFGFWWYRRGATMARRESSVARQRLEEAPFRQPPD